MTKLVRVEVAGRVAAITLDRPGGAERDLDRAGHGAGRRRGAAGHRPRGAGGGPDRGRGARLLRRGRPQAAGRLRRPRLVRAAGGVPARVRRRPPLSPADGGGRGRLRPRRRHRAGPGLRPGGGRRRRHLRAAGVRLGLVPAGAVPSCWSGGWAGRWPRTWSSPAATRPRARGPQLGLVDRVVPRGEVLAAATAWRPRSRPTPRPPSAWPSGPWTWAPTWPRRRPWRSRIRPGGGPSSPTTAARASPPGSSGAIPSTSGPGRRCGPARWPGQARTRSSSRPGRRRRPSGRGGRRTGRGPGRSWTRGWWTRRRGPQAAAVADLDRSRWSEIR